MEIGWESGVADRQGGSGWRGEVRPIKCDMFMYQYPARNLLMYGNHMLTKKEREILYSINLYAFLLQICPYTHPQAFQKEITALL